MLEKSRSDMRSKKLSNMVWPLWGCKNSDTIHTSDWKCQEVFLIENVKKASNFRKNLLPSTDLKWARMFSASWKATKLEKLCWRKESRRNYVFCHFLLNKNFATIFWQTKCCREGGDEDKHLWRDSANSWTQPYSRFTKVQQWLYFTTIY